MATARLAGVEVAEVDLSRAADRGLELRRLHRHGGDAARAADGEALEADVVDRHDDGRARLDPDVARQIDLQAALAAGALQPGLNERQDVVVGDDLDRLASGRSQDDGERRAEADADECAEVAALRGGDARALDERLASRRAAKGSKASAARARKGLRARFIVISRGSMASILARSSGIAPGPGDELRARRNVLSAGAMD